MDIVAKLLEQKWADDMIRRDQMSTYLDYYQFNQKEHLKRHIDSRFKLSETRKVLKQYLETYSLTDEIIDEISILFRDPCLVSVTSGASEPAQKTIQENFQEMLNDSQFDMVMNEVDKYENLLFKVAVIPVYRDGIVELDIITPDRIFVTQDDKDPNKITELYYYLNTAENTPLKATRIDTYVKWTAEQQSLVNIDPETGRVTNEWDETPNLYGEIPAVFFGKRGLGTFWLENNSKIVDGNVNLNMRLTNFDVMMAYQSYSTLVFSNARVDSTKNMPFGPQFLVEVESLDGAIPASADYKNPSAPIEVTWKIIKEYKQMVAESVGISSEGSDNGQYESGYKLKLSKQDILNYNKQKRSYFTPSVKKLIYLMMETWNLSDEKTQYPEPKEIIVKLDYSEPVFEQDPLEKQQVRVLKTQEGTWSPIRSLMADNPDLNEEEAILLYEKLQKEKAITESTTEDLENAINGN
jgi:hypothetical protein